MVRDLNVWFFGECVGVLTQDMGQLSFRYLPQWLESKSAIPLSQSLPLIAEPFNL
jgi:serine/threonine-protein kinase HipA